MDRQLGVGIAGFALAVALGLAATTAHGQGPTVPVRTRPAIGGSEGSRLGPAPGSGGSPDGAQGGAGTSSGFLGGRPGVSVGRTPRRGGRQAGGGPGTPPAIALPPPLPEADVPASIPLALPGDRDEGPADGLTLDQAIERLVRDNLDLRAQFLEIPQAEADVLTAGLRANPVFYADAQLVPYGGFSDKRPGGSTQYDVNVSIPLDLSGKRKARVDSACRVKRVLEAQYQDAVRLQIGNLYTAYVDVLAARETARFAAEGLRGMQPIVATTRDLVRRGGKSPSDLDRVLLQRDAAGVGRDAAEEALTDAKNTLAQLLALPTAVSVDGLALRGSIRVISPPPPDAESLVAMALSQRPDLIAARLGLSRAEADVRLARANRLDDAYLLYQPYTFQDLSPFHVKSSHSWAIGLTVPLPISNRNQGNIRRAEINVNQTHIELVALERRIAGEVRRARREYDASKRTVDRVGRELLPDATDLIGRLKDLLARGEVEIVDYLVAQREYNDVVRQYRDALVRHRRAMLELNTAVGRRIMP